MRTHPKIRARHATAAAALLALLAPAAGATSWWLPANYAEHGVSLDSLFNFIFWLTSIVMVGTFAAMLYFMLKYRRRKRPEGEADPKAHFSHGNPKLEMIWTIAPAI